MQAYGQHPESGHADSHQRLQSAATAARQAAMAVLARASGEELHHGLVQAECDLTCEDLRAPEVGLIMARGRISGTGQPFNVGEVAVSRAAVRLGCGVTGFAYLLGRDPDRARLAAVADAYWQKSDKRAAVEAYLLAPVRARIAAEKKKQDEQVAATQVDFFTMVRGDD